MVVTRNQHKFNKALEKLTEEKGKNSRRIIRCIAWKEKLTSHLAYHEYHNYPLQPEAKLNRSRQQFVKKMFIKRILNSTYENIFGKKISQWPDQKMKLYYKKIKKVFKKIYCKINVQRIVSTIKNTEPIEDIMIMEAMQELNC